MNVDHRQVALAWSRRKTLEDEFAGAGNIEQGQILRGRTDEDQVVVLGVIKRKESTALDSQRAVEKRKDAVELVDCKHLAHARVVVEDKCAAIGRGIEIAHPRLRPSHEPAVTEDDPWLL